MSSIWRLIETALNEASEKDALLAHIRSTKGDGVADQMAPFLDQMWDADGLPKLAKYFAANYNDKTVDSIFDKAMASLPPSSSGMRTAVAKRSGGVSTDLATSEPVVKKGRGRPPGSTNKAKAAAPSQTQYRDPEQVKAGQASVAAVAATRPDRAGVSGNVMPKAGMKIEPGVPVQHDVGQSVRGTSPGHTKPPIDQPSQLIQPSKLDSQLKPLQAREKQLQKLITLDLKNNPAKKIQLAKAEDELKKVQQKIASVKNIDSSGVKDAQKEVDTRTSTYGAKLGDELARKRGVPTTAQRTRKSIDPETGKEKTTVQIWDQEKVYAFMNKGGASQSGKLRIDPEIEPGTYDGPASADHGAAGPLRKNAMTGGQLPFADVGGKGRAASQVVKPMMKAPKGLDKDGLAQLSALRSQYGKLKKSGGSPEEMENLKGQIDQIMKSGAEIVDVVRPGIRKGMRWKPSGVSQKVKTTRANQNTGNFQYGSRFTNPAEEGPELVWDGNDWVLDSQMAANAGAKAAETD